METAATVSVAKFETLDLRLLADYTIYPPDTGNNFLASVGGLSKN